jgi:Protein of unknown function (DUF2938)
MTEAMESVLRALLIGAGATAVLDLWSLLLKRLFGVPTSSWSMVGRWVGHFRRGRFAHSSIAAAEPVQGELALGWLTHYATGVVYGGLLLALCGLEWARQPTLLPALIVGIATVVAPFFVMQPGMGAGIAGSKTPNPAQVRLRSLMNHTVFGLGLYLAAVLAAILVPAR